MARARTIKHGFFTNDSLAGLPMATRLLFAGLWTIADREGRLLDRPKKIKADVMPYDEMDADDALQQLADAGFLVRYKVNSVRLLQVIHWDKHQHPHPNEPGSEFEPPPVLKKSVRPSLQATSDSGSPSYQASEDSGRSPVSGTLTIPSGHRVTPSRRARAAAHARARDGDPPDESSDSANICGACGAPLKAADRRRNLALCGECHGAALFAAARAGRPVDVLNVQDLIELATQARNGDA